MQCVAQENPQDISGILFQESLSVLIASDYKVFLFGDRLPAAASAKIHLSRSPRDNDTTT
ncbi:MAG: hypothetical protein ABII64_06990 [Elusimicrobiota bacterium]